MVAWVPTGMNTGVSTVPCFKRIRPARAREVVHLFETLKKVVVFEDSGVGADILSKKMTNFDL
jgi:hypothetical protein